MNRPDYLLSYRQTLAQLTAAHGEDVAMDLIGGGQPDAIGILVAIKDGIAARCRHLRLGVTALHDGRAPWIELVRRFRHADGRGAAGTAELGQSVAVITRPA